MDKEKEIEEMCEIARKYSEDIANTPYYKGVKTDMEAIYEAGYRKAEEVRKETLIGVVDYLRKSVNVPMSRVVDKLTYLLENSFGVEVDE